MLSYANIDFVFYYYVHVSHPLMEGLFGLPQCVFLTVSLSFNCALPFQPCVFPMDHTQQNKEPSLIMHMCLLYMCYILLCIQSAFWAFLQPMRMIWAIMLRVNLLWLVPVSGILRWGRLRREETSRYYWKSMHNNTQSHQSCIIKLPCLGFSFGSSWRNDYS